MEQKKVNIIHYIIVAAFCLLFRFIPGFAGITPLGMGILGSFIGAIYGWITIDMLWPSLMALCGVGLSIGMNQMLAASFGNMAVVALVLCMGVLGISMTTGAFNIYFPHSNKKMISTIIGYATPTFSRYTSYFHVNNVSIPAQCEGAPVYSILDEEL